MIHSRFSFLILFMLLFSCRPGIEPTNPEPLGCDQSGAVMHEVSLVSGVVGYHLNSTQLMLSYYVPGTIDSQWTGVVCNLPNEYRVFGKQVTFSGEFRDAKNTLRPVFGGESMYYLYLTDIKSR